MADIICCYIPTKSSGLWRIRVDNPHGSQRHHQRHVHLSRSGLNGEYSWNIDGSRHDKHRFPSSEKHIASAKRIASETLKIPVSRLQFLAEFDASSHVSIAEVRSPRRARSLFATYVHQKEYMALFGATNELLVAVRAKV